MPGEQGYRSQVGPGGAQRAVLTSPEAYGAGVAATLANAGEDLHRLQLRSYQLDRKEQAESQSAEVARRSAEARLEIDDEIRKARETAKPGAAGHREAVAAVIAARKEKLFEGISEDAVRRSAEASWNDYATRVESNEADWQIGKRIAHDTDNFRVAGEVARNRVKRSAGDKVIYEEELTYGYANADNLNIDADTKEALKREFEQGLTVDWLDGRKEKEAQIVKMELAGGVYDGVLTSDQIDALNRGMDVEIKAQAYEAERTAQEQRIAARNDAELVEAEFERGNFLPEKEVAARMVQWRAAGLPEADIVRLTTKIGDARNLRSVSKEADPEGTRASQWLIDIREKIRLNTATPEEWRIAPTLEKIVEARGEEIGKQFKELGAGGIAGQQEALAQLDALPKEVRFKAAQELNPKANLGYLSLLPAFTRQYALDGREVRAARPKDFGEKTEVEDAWRRTMGPLAASLGGEFDEYRDLAWNIYAGTMNANNLQGWDPARFNTAMRIAFGATKNKQGKLQGGLGLVRQKPVLLPDWKTPEQFDASFSKLTFKGAVYDDMEPVSKADIVKRYRPEFYRETPEGNPVYRLISPGGKPLYHKDGDVWDFEVRR